MKKLLIIVIIFGIIVAGVSIYSCQIKKGVEADEPIGGLYSGQVVAVANNQNATVIYFANNFKPLKVVGSWALQIGAFYVITTRETNLGLEVTGIQIKK